MNFFFSVLVAIYCHTPYAYVIWLKCCRYVVKPYLINRMLHVNVQSNRKYEHAAIESSNEFPLFKSDKLSQTILSRLFKVLYHLQTKFLVLASDVRYPTLQEILGVRYKSIWHETSPRSVIERAFTCIYMYRHCISYRASLSSRSQIRVELQTRHTILIDIGIPTLLVLGKFN